MLGRKANGFLRFFSKHLAVDRHAHAVLPADEFLPVRTPVEDDVAMVRLPQQSSCLAEDDGGVVHGVLAGFASHESGFSTNMTLAATASWFL